MLWLESSKHILYAYAKVKGTCTGTILPDDGRDKCRAAQWILVKMETNLAISEICVVKNSHFPNKFERASFHLVFDIDIVKNIREVNINMTSNSFSQVYIYCSYFQPATISMATSTVPCLLMRRYNNSYSECLSLSEYSHVDSLLSHRTVWCITPN